MQLKITREEWTGDCNHFLYVETPNIVKGKIEAHIQSGIRPTINYSDEDSYGDFIYQSDILLYPTEKTIDKAREIFCALTNAIAILAFVPGGIRIFGWHYEVIENGSGET